ncbi:MAG: CDP-alcohol phosphatidyltransferase family protein [Candidatus Caldarchaeales archaeon]|jgi:archaetidylinositol phosphate synthase|nr:CDP-alcohol phosphatidyltransferase family protein [Candidatus Caldarchaeales archaeon]
MSRSGKRRRELESRILSMATRQLILRLAQSGITPNSLTYAAFIVAAAASILYGLSRYSATLAALAGAVYLLSALLDVLDGQLARLSGRVTKLGGFLDSALDKAAEILVCVGIALSGLTDHLSPLLFCASSLYVSYTRARGEGVGVDLSGIGPAERGERVLIITAASLLMLLHRDALVMGLYVGAALSAATGIRRTIYAVRALSR